MPRRSSKAPSPRKSQKPDKTPEPSDSPSIEDPQAAAAADRAPAGATPEDPPAPALAPTKWIGREDEAALELLEELLGTKPDGTAVGEPDDVVQPIGRRLSAVEDVTVTLAERISHLKDTVNGQGDRTHDSLRLLGEHIGKEVSDMARRLQAVERSSERVRRAVEALESNVHRILTAMEQSPSSPPPGARSRSKRKDPQMASLIERVWDEGQTGQPEG